jgi:hypothetical protein
MRCTISHHHQCLVRETKCTCKVRLSTKQCSVGPGMTLAMAGSNFGTSGGISLCYCLGATIVKWTPTRVVALVNLVKPGAGWI